MLSTRDVAARLELTPAALRQHIYNGNVAAPDRRIGGAMVWSEAEAEAAARALRAPGRRRPRYTVQALAEGGTA